MYLINPLNPKYIFGHINPKVHFWLHHTARCACLGEICISRKGGTGGGGWSHPQGDMHMVVARLGFEGSRNGWYWVSRLEVDMGSILELELGQK